MEGPDPPQRTSGGGGGESSPPRRCGEEAPLREGAACFINFKAPVGAGVIKFALMKKNLVLLNMDEGKIIRPRTLAPRRRARPDDLPF